MCASTLLDADCALPQQAEAEIVARADFAFTLLPRHGQRPLGFHGRLLVSAVAKAPSLPVESLVALHETDSGALVAAIRHTTRPPLPPESRCYAATAAADELLDFLQGHDPLRDMPSHWLLSDAQGDDLERLVACAGLGERLRAAWHGLVAACCGNPTLDMDLEPGEPR
jgi:hypothetical protein